MAQSFDLASCIARTSHHFRRHGGHPVLGRALSHHTQCRRSAVEALLDSGPDGAHANAIPPATALGAIAATRISNHGSREGRSMASARPAGSGRLLLTETGSSLLSSRTR